MGKHILLKMFTDFKSILDIIPKCLETFKNRLITYADLIRQVYGKQEVPTI